jgi:hypothetical protein
MQTAKAPLARKDHREKNINVKGLGKDHRIGIGNLKKSYPYRRKL